jgi:hypothetical protein
MNCPASSPGLGSFSGVRPEIQKFHENYPLVGKASKEFILLLRTVHLREVN